MLKFIGVSCLLLFLSSANAEIAMSLGRTNVNEWFSRKIEPKMFNLTLEQPDQFEFRFSKRNYPDLPSWMRFMYSIEYNAGYLYGTPPKDVAAQDVCNL